MGYINRVDKVANNKRIEKLFFHLLAILNSYIILSSCSNRTGH